MFEPDCYPLWNVCCIYLDYIEPTEKEAYDFSAWKKPSYSCTNPAALLAFEMTTVLLKNLSLSLSVLKVAATLAITVNLSSITKVTEVLSAVALLYFF